MMSQVIVISVRDNFSRFPAGRFLSDGPFSGERFREEQLYPALQKAERVIVKMDGTLGYGSSFLEEAFGGLVRTKQLTANLLQQKLVIDSKDPTLSAVIWGYINKTKPGEARV